MASFVISSISFVLLLSMTCYAKLPETELSTVELVKYWGYPVETHKVVTRDGYILTLHRIPYSKVNLTDMGNTTRPVFLLQHALICASSSFVLNLPHQNLPFLLANAGYDVWMGNARGNTYSKKHISRSTNSQEFWDFSFQEMAEYDLPAMIDYTLNHTKQKQLYYVGHSQGTLMAFAGLSENMELQKKIKVFFAMAPVTRIQHTTYFIRLLSWFRRPIRWICNLRGAYEVLPSTAEAKIFGKWFCPWFPWICKQFIFFVNGYDQKNTNTTRIPLYVTNILAGTSEKNFDHYFQNVYSGLLQKYDYGMVGNIKRYGKTIPPKYHLKNIKVPVVLIHGEHDSIVPPGDVDWTAKHLPNLQKKILVKGYNHLDFILATNAYKAVYNHIMDIAEKDRHA